MTTAASYLIIIQTLEQPSVSNKCTEELLDAAFGSGDLETGKELIRYLTSCEGTQALSYEGLNENHEGPMATPSIPKSKDHEAFSLVTVL